MKKLLLSTILSAISLIVLCQDKAVIKHPSLGVHFIFNDFKTASNISSTSLSSTILNKQFGKIKAMSPGLALSYQQGICDKLDFAATVNGSFLDYTSSTGKILGTNALLLEVDASIHAKMLPDNYWVVPYLNVGVGLSKYKGYYGAVMPLGVGLQINVISGTFIMIDSQYRTKVSENTNNHFMHSFGIIGNLGSL